MRAKDRLPCLWRRFFPRRRSEEEAMKKFYVTTPIYYVNDVPHLGHAYTTIAADVIARYKRLKGYDVFFLTGTDEHGQKIEKSAKEKGITPKELADQVVVNFKRLWERLNITYNHFIRTTDDYHERVVQEIFQRLYDKGDIYLGEYEGWYCTPCESFWSKSQLVEGKLCPDCGRPVERLKEKSYFFRLSAYQDRLLEFYEKNPDFVLPRFRMNEVKAFVKQGLEDISISRTTFKWGIPVPFDRDHVIYVWFDALFNYISGIGYGRDEEKFRRYWPADVHIIGKDILRFHAIYWPAFLMAAGFEPPKRLFTHGWWTVEGRKMSKSLRNVVDPNRLIDTYGADAVRYFLLREVPFGLDGDFSHKALAHRINGELANDLGNLVFRVLTMTVKYMDGVIPTPTESRDRELEELATRMVEEVDRHLEVLAFNRALESIWEVVRAANKYIDTKAPWSLAKEGRREELANVLYNLLETIRIVGVITHPFMPTKMGDLLEQLSCSREPSEDDLQWGKLPCGKKVKKGKPLFPRVDEEKIAEEIEKELAEGEKEEAPEVSIEEFARMRIVVAEVLHAERVPKTDKLLKLILDTGKDKRTVVAGIGAHYSPEELVGRKVLYLSNLKPKKLRGITSQGMILAASDGERLYLPQFPEDTPKGALVR